MGDVLAALARRADERLEGHHPLQLRYPRLMALLDGRDGNLLQARQLDDVTLGELTVEQRQPVDAHLRHLLQHPLHAVHHLRWGDGQLDVALPLSLLRQRLEDSVAAMVRGSHRHLCTVVVPYPIHQEELVALLQPQDPYGMLTLVSRQLCAVRGIRDVEESYLFHTLTITVLHSLFQGGRPVRTRRPPPRRRRQR